jgi:hypothetical protein
MLLRIQPNDPDRSEQELKSHGRIERFGYNNGTAECHGIRFKPQCTCQVRIRHYTASINLGLSIETPHKTWFLSGMSSYFE